MSIPPVCVCHRLRAELPRIAAVVLAALLAAAQAAAQNDSEAGAAAAAAASKASVGTPRADMESFLVAARKGDFSRAAAYLDLRRVPESERESRGPDLARRLKIVLDRALWVDLDALSEDTEGFPNDGLRARRDLVGTIPSQAGDVAIHLDRVLDVDGTSRWRISGGTLAQVPRLYEEFGYGPVEELLPRVFWTSTSWSLPSGSGSGPPGDSYWPSWQDGSPPSACSRSAGLWFAARAGRSTIACSMPPCSRCAWR